MGESPIASRAISYTYREADSINRSLLRSYHVITVEVPTLSNPLQGLVLLYFAVTNGDDEHERAAAAELLQRWDSTLDDEAARAVVDTACLATRSGLAADVDTLARQLGPSLSPAWRRRVLSDLGRLAQADGHVTVGEAHVISRVRSSWASLAS